MQDQSLSPEVCSKLSGASDIVAHIQETSHTFERCCASQLFGGARLCCWAPDAVKSRMVLMPNEWMNPRSKCTSFSNLALCSTRSPWRKKARQRLVGRLVFERETNLEPQPFFLEDLDPSFGLFVYTLGGAYQAAHSGAELSINIPR